MSADFEAKTAMSVALRLSISDAIEVDVTVPSSAINREGHPPETPVADLTRGLGASRQRRPATSLTSGRGSFCRLEANECLEELKPLDRLPFSLFVKLYVRPLKGRLCPTGNT